MKWYNVELNKVDSDLFRTELKTNNIYYEASGAGKMTHFEIKCNKEQLNRLNNFLDTL